MSNQVTCSHCGGACDERAICDDNDAAICWECQQRGVSLPELRLKARVGNELRALSCAVQAFAVAEKTEARRDRLAATGFFKLKLGEPMIAQTLEHVLAKFPAARRENDGSITVPECPICCD